MDASSSAATIRQRNVTDTAKRSQPMPISSATTVTGAPSLIGRNPRTAEPPPWFTGAPGAGSVVAHSSSAAADTVDVTYDEGDMVPLTLHAVGDEDVYGTAAGTSATDPSRRLTSLPASSSRSPHTSRCAASFGLTVHVDPTRTSCTAIQIMQARALAAGVPLPANPSPEELADALVTHTGQDKQLSLQLATIAAKKGGNPHAVPLSILSSIGIGIYGPGSLSHVYIATESREGVSPPSSLVVSPELMRQLRTFASADGFISPAQLKAYQNSRFEAESSLMGSKKEKVLNLFKRVAELHLLEGLLSGHRDAGGRYPIDVVVAVLEQKTMEEFHAATGVEFRISTQPATRSSLACHLFKNIARVLWY